MKSKGKGGKKPGYGDKFTAFTGKKGKGSKSRAGC